MIGVRVELGSDTARFGVAARAENIQRAVAPVGLVELEMPKSVAGKARGSSRDAENSTSTPRER